MAIGKGVDKQPNADVKSREETISEFLEFADGLAEEAKKITDTDEEVERLKRKIKSLRTDIEGLKQLNEKKFKTRIEKLTESRSLLVKEVKFAIDGVADWQIRRKEKEIKDLQARAALEDMEFTKFKEHYFDAEGRLGDFVNFIKKYNLEAGKEESVENLKKLLEELKTLLDNKNYKDFTNKYDGFKYVVGGLLAKAYDEKTEQEEASKTTEPAKETEPPTAEPAAAPAAPSASPEATPQATLADLVREKESQKKRKEKGVVAKKLVPSLGLRKDNAPDAATDERNEEQKKAAYESGKALHEENKKKFDGLIEDIKFVDKKTNQKGKFFNSFQKELGTLYECWKNDYELDDKDEFDANMKLFNDIYKQAKERLEVERAKIEVKPKDKPAVQKTAAEEEKEAEEQEQRYLQRKKCVSNFYLLKRIIRGADRKENNHKLFDAAKKELAVLEDYLANQKTANNPEKLDLAEFNKNINAFNEAAKTLAASLGPDVKEAFERGGLPEPAKNEPAPATAQAIESKPVGREMTAEQKKEREQRKRLCDDRWISLKSLENIIRGTDYESGLKVVEDLLLKVYASLDDAEDFDKRIGEFGDAWEKFHDDLRPDIKEKFDRRALRGAAKPAEAPNNEPAKPQSLDAGKEGGKLERRERLLAELSGDLLLLEQSIDKEVKNRPSGYFARGIDNLKKYLKNARRFIKEERFSGNVSEFEKLIDDLKKEVETAVAESKNLAKEAEPPVPSTVLPISPEVAPPAPLATEPTAPAEPVSKKRVGAKKTPERKMRILDIPERDLLEIVGEKKLQEVVNEIILGNADVAKVLMKDIFSRKDIDLKHLNNVLEKFGYTPAQFMKEWAETLHVRAFEVAKQWVEQMSRNWLNKNITWWEKLKANPMAHAKLAAVNILPFAALSGSLGVLVATGGASHAARGAVVGGAAGLLRGLKAKVGSVRGWFEKRKENAREQIATGGKKIEEEKAIPLRDGLLAQFTGENGPDMMGQLSAMLSQSLRDASAAGVQKEAVEKLKSGAAVTVEEISAKIDAEFKVMKKSAGEETAKEVQRSQTERAETLIKKLYEDKDLEALIQKLIERDPKIVSKLKGLKINGVEFGKFIKPDDKDPAKKESNARKAASVLASVAAGASIGGAIAAAPELRAVLGAVVGGYLGVKYGHLKDRRAREAQFEKEFKDSVANAEKVIEEWETRQVKEPLLEPTSENIKELAERAKDLRAPLTLGMLEGDINLKLRAQNALRRLESLQINLYINQNPAAEEQPIPEAQRNRGVERLLTGLNSELEELTKQQQNIEQRILRKPGWWRAVGYGIVGAVAGAGAGYGTAKAQEYWRGHHKPVSHPTAEEGVQHQQAAPEHVAVAPVEQTHPLEHPSTFKPHEGPVPTETEVIEHGDHTVAVEVLNNREGVLNGVNRLMRAHPELFRHKDGTDWTVGERRHWRAENLVKMGYKYDKHGDLWDPLTVHAKAEVGLYTDQNGQPYFKLASDKHVTFHGHYKVEASKHVGIVLTEPVGAEKEAFKIVEPTSTFGEGKIVDTGALAGRKGDYLINPFPDNYGAAHVPIANADVMTESATTHTPVKVDANIKDIAVHHAPKVSESVSKGGEINNQKVAPENIAPTKGAAATPEKTPVVAEVAAGEKTAEQFLTEHGSNPKEFIAVYDKMVDHTIDRLHDSLILRGGGAGKFLQSQIDALYHTGMTQGNIAGVNSRTFPLMEKILNAEDKFKLNQPDWLKTFSQTMFDKSDKAMRLALLPDRDVLLEPIKTNGGHAVRIWDETEQKDVFFYDKDRVFNTKDDGRLVVEDEHGVTKIFNQKQALKMAEEE